MSKIEEMHKTVGRGALDAPIFAPFYGVPRAARPTKHIEICAIYTLIYIKFVSCSFIRYY